MRPRVPLARFTRPALALLSLTWLFSAALGEAQAQTSAPEPILFLGIQRGSNTDRVGSDLVREYLVDRGELVLKTVQLAEADRRCRRQQCLSELAAAKQAVLVLSGDVSTTGPTRNLRVQVRLFDQRRRGTPDALAEIENLCIDCDETKLGIMLTSSTSELLTQYRQFAGSAAPSPAASPALPSSVASPAAQSSQAPWPAWMPRPAASSPAPAAAAPPLPAAVPPPAPAPSATPVYQAPPTVAPTAPPAAVVYPVLPSAPPAVAAPLPAKAPSYASPESGYPQTPPPLPSRQAPPPAAPFIEPPRPAPPTSAKKPLSPVRKGIAATFGILGFGSLITAAVMHGLDRRLTPDLSINSMGTACQMPENAGRSCVLSTVGVYAPTYAVGALLVGGMILTLTIPESKPRPLSEPLVP